MNSTIPSHGISFKSPSGRTQPSDALKNSRSVTPTISSPSSDSEKDSSSLRRETGNIAGKFFTAKTADQFFIAPQKTTFRPIVSALEEKAASFQATHAAHGTKAAGKAWSVRAAHASHVAHVAKVTKAVEAAKKAYYETPQVASEASNRAPDAAYYQAIRAARNRAPKTPYYQGSIDARFAAAQLAYDRAAQRAYHQDARAAKDAHYRRG